MKKWIAITLIASILLVLLPLLYFYTGSDQTVSDVDALEEQVLGDWIKKHNLSKDTHFYSFQYYGTDNGYHIVVFNLSQFSFGVTNDVDIAGCTFQGLGYEDNFMAYKNGMFIQLKLAHHFRLVGAEAIAKAAELHQAVLEKSIERQQIQDAFRDRYGKFKSFRFYGEENGHHIFFAQVKSRPQVLTVKQIAGSEFRYPEEFSLYAYIDGEFIDLEEAYNKGLVSKEAIAKAAELHAANKNATD